MKTLHSSNRSHYEGPTLWPVALLMAVAISLALLGLVTGLFAQASRMPWLADTPENQARMAPCAATLGSAAKRQCAEQVVAEVVNDTPAAAGGVQVARTEADPAGHGAVLPR